VGARHGRPPDPRGRPAADDEDRDLLPGVLVEVVRRLLVT
jgi:hypothetical protein